MPEAPLDDAQRAAVDSDHPRILILAGAGSGKTRTLTRRAARLVRDGVAPERIVLVTFTNRAAHEMILRAAELLGDRALRIRAGTFHQLAFRALRRHGAKIGLPARLTILDRRSARALLAPLAKGVDGVLDVLSHAVNADVPLAVAQRRRDAPIRDLERIADAYARVKAERGALDFDDLLVAWEALLAAVPEAAEDAAHVLVDEYQDTNPVQARIAARLGGHLCAVGDDAQAIYAFRGARHENLLELAADPATEVHTLTTSYRSQPAILDLANHIIANNRRQLDKALFSPRPRGPLPLLLRPSDEEDEAMTIVERVKALRDEGVPLTNQAVLYRLHRHGEHLEVALAEQRIPYVVRGARRLFETAGFADLVAYASVLAGDDDDRFWRRILARQPGVGPRTIARVLAAPGPRVPPYAFLRGAARLEPLADRLTALGELAPAAALRRLLAEEALGGDALLPLVATAEAHERFETLVADWLLSSDPPVANEDGALTLGTIHQAKGLEWDAVHVLRLVEDAFPHRGDGEPDHIEEERRLFFVAATRARDHLTVSAPIATRRDVGLLPSTPSRFLQELPGRLFS